VSLSAAHGLADKIVFPAFSAALKRRMPHAHLEMIPGALSRPRQHKFRILQAATLSVDAIQ
jgi:hypothetical protein